MVTEGIFINNERSLYLEQQRKELSDRIEALGTQSREYRRRRRNWFAIGMVSAGLAVGLPAYQAARLSTTPSVPSTVAQVRSITDDARICMDAAKTVESLDDCFARAHTDFTTFLASPASSTYGDDLARYRAEIGADTARKAEIFNTTFFGMLLSTSCMLLAGSRSLRYELKAKACDLEILHRQTSMTSPTHGDVDFL